MTSQTLKIITCGGTIDKIYFDAKNEFHIGEPQIVTVLRESNIAIPYEVESILKKDSLNMNDEDRMLVKTTVEKSAESQILITHGTDSMVMTAKVLLGIAGKTIVFTGSMEPAKFKVTDAIFNIGFAVAAVQTLSPGVYIAMNGRIFNPSRTVKNVAENRFEEIN